MNKRFLAITLIFLLIIGFMPNVKAIALISTDTITEGIQDYNSYDITFDSNGSNYIKTNELRVTDGKMKIVTTFSNASMITLNGVTLNGKKADYIIHEVTNNELTIETVINSLDDQINFDMQIKVPIINMVKNVDLHIKNIKLVNNTYDFDAETNGTKYMKSKSLKVENGEMTVITTFNMGSMINVNSTTVNGEEVESVVNSGDMNTLIIETKINSLDDDINFNMTITVPGVMTTTQNLYLRDLRLPGVDIIDDSEDEDAPEEDEDDSTEEGDNGGDNEDNGSVDDDSDNDVNNKVLKDGNYTIESDFIKTGTTNEESAAAGYIEKVSSLKVENGDYYLTLDIKEIGVLSNIGANIDGKETDVTVTESGDGKGKISFKINSLSSDILIKCRITVSQINFVMDTNFNVVLNKSTLKNENGEDVEGPDEDTDIPIYKNATYTIENTVSGIAPDSPIVGVISPKNTITVEDGKIYLTVTFYKSGFMDGRIITLNNNTTPARYSIEEDTSNKVTVKINIYSVNDKIKFSSKNSKSLDDGFTLLLLKDTLKEQISNDSTNSGGSSSDDDDNEDDDLEDGTYVIKNKVLKENSDNESYARDYVDKESIITVKNGKIYLTLKFTHGKMMSDTSIKVEGKKTSYSTVKKSGNNYHIKFKIGALDDEVLVTTTIDTGVSSIGKQEGVKFRVLLRESTLEEYDDDDDDDDEDNAEEKTEESNSSTGTTTGTVSGTVSGNTNNTVIIDDTLNNVVDLGIQSGSYKRETYSVTNDIVTDSTIGYQAARGAIETKSYMQVEQDKKYMIVNFANTDGMSNIRLSMNGQNIAYEILKEGNNQLIVRFETPDVSTQVDVTATIPMLGRDISFGLKFNESTLTYIGTEEVGISADGGSESSSMLNNILSTTTFIGESTSVQGSVGSSSSDGSSSSEFEGAGEEAVEAKEYYKKYTIENEVLSDSIMGRTMARKYLNTLSTIDDIDGQLYLTLTFSGSNAMDNFVFTVNGENREYSVVSNLDNDLKAFKFKIDSVNDTIDVGIFIKPVKMNISFGVKLLEDTMVLIDEGEITSGGEFSEEDANEEFLAKSLSVQQRGSSNNELSVFKIAIVTSLMTTGMNACLVGIIYLIIRRKNKKKLNKEAKTN